MPPAEVEMHSFKVRPLGTNAKLRQYVDRIAKVYIRIVLINRGILVFLISSLLPLTQAYAIDWHRLLGNDSAKWNLPQELSEKNIQLSFEVDTTMHLVKGAVTGISGKAWLEDETDPSSIRAEIKLPLNLFNTGNESRDRKLREVMGFAHQPELVFRILSVKEICSPQSLVSQGTCHGSINGELKINEITRGISFPIVIHRDGDIFEVSGETSVSWPDYNVEDPSTFLAKLEKDVRVHFICRL